MNENFLRFDTLPQREKERIYAHCYGNPMKIAEYLNLTNKVRNGEDGFVCFQDIQNILDNLSKEDMDGLVKAKEMNIDKKLWETFEDGNPSFVHKTAEKFHPAMRGKQITHIPTLRIEHILKAAELSGESKEEIAENIDFEVIDDNEE